MSYRKAIWQQYKKDFRSAHLWLHILLGLVPVIGTVLTSVYLLRHGPGSFDAYHELVPAIIEGICFLTLIGFYLVFMLGGARHKVYAANKEEIKCLKRKLEALTAIPTEPRLTADLRFQNDLAELVIRNAGAATSISARWKIENQPPERFALLGKSSGYQEMAFTGGAASERIGSATGVHHLRVADCQVQGSPAGPGNPPQFGWTIPYLNRAGQVVTFHFPSVPTSPNPMAPYTQLVLLVEVRSSTGNVESLTRRIAIQGHTCILVES